MKMASDSHIVIPNSEESFLFEGLIMGNVTLDTFVSLQDGSIVRVGVVVEVDGGLGPC